MMVMLIFARLEMWNETSMYRSAFLCLSIAILTCSVVMNGSGTADGDAWIANDDDDGVLSSQRRIHLKRFKNDSISPTQRVGRRCFQRAYPTCLGPIGSSNILQRLVEGNYCQSRRMGILKICCCPGLIVAGREIRIDRKTSDFN